MVELPHGLERLGLKTTDANFVCVVGASTSGQPPPPPSWISHSLPLMCTRCFSKKERTAVELTQQDDRLQEELKPLSRWCSLSYLNGYLVSQVHRRYRREMKLNEGSEKAPKPHRQLLNGPVRLRARRKGRSHYVPCAELTILLLSSLRVKRAVTLRYLVSTQP